MGCNFCGDDASSANTGQVPAANVPAANVPAANVPAPNVPKPNDNIFMSSLNDIASSQAGRAKSVFDPLEDQLAGSVQQFQGTDYADKQAGMAEASVGRTFAQAKEAADANLASMGVNPNSGRYGYVKRGLAESEALGKAAAGTTSRENTRRLAFDTLSGVSARGDAKTAQAIGAAQAGGGLYNAGVNQQLDSEKIGLASQDLGLKSQQIGLDSQRLKLGLDQQNANADSSAWGGIGQLAGAALGAFMLSSKKAKTQRKLATGALEATRKMPVQTYRYKRGLGPAGPRIGPMAEDMAAATGTGNGTHILPQDLMGVTLGAVQQLDKKVSRMEKR